MTVEGSKANVSFTTGAESGARHGGNALRLQKASAEIFAAQACAADGWKNIKRAVRLEAVQPHSAEGSDHQRFSEAKGMVLNAIRNATH